MVPVAVEALRGSGVKVASVATAFPSGRASLAVKLADVATRSRPAPTRSTW
jgi:deoxyribose-phosphate aldolase